MPQPHELPPGLPEVRAEIDRIDAELIRILAIRVAEVMRAAQVKHAAGIPFRDEEREEQVIENAVERGEELGLPKKQVRKIFKQIIRISHALRTDGD
jgi:isochorismate pyruvate lyase